MIINRKHRHGGNGMSQRSLPVAPVARNEQGVLEKWLNICTCGATRICTTERDAHGLVGQYKERWVP